MRWQSWWFERNIALQRRLQPAGGQLRDPLFVLGFWRSGTTFLHELLATCPSLRPPATWQCMAPSTFLLAGPPPADSLVQRPMDGITISSASPQENEFALMALGVPSVYRGFFDPRRLPELGQWLDPLQWRVEFPAEWLSIWCGFLAGVQGSDPRRLVLKSPPHSFRIRALVHAFPALNVVWVVRDPQEVLHSNRKMWVAMFKRYAAWKCDLGTLDDFLSQALGHLAASLEFLVQTLPRSRAAVVDFQSLTSSPAEAMQRVNQRFELAEWAEWMPAVQEIAARTSEFRHDEYAHLEVSGRWSAVLDRVRNAQRSALLSHGI